MGRLSSRQWWAVTAVGEHGQRDEGLWAMESEGFTVFESEWWHFDYKDWREYAIENIPFEKLNVAKK